MNNTKVRTTKRVRKEELELEPNIDREIKMHHRDKDGDTVNINIDELEINADFDDVDCVKESVTDHTNGKTVMYKGVEFPYDDLGFFD